MIENWLLESLSTVASSTTSHGARLAEWGQAQLRANEGRADGGRRVAQERHEALRNRILRAVGTLDPTHPAFVPILRRRIERDIGAPVPMYGLKACPDNRTLRKVQAYLLQRKLG